MTSWGRKQDLTQLSSITNTEQYFSAIEMEPREVIHCQLTFNFPASPTDDGEIRVYTTLDEDTETWDDTSYIDAITVDSATDPNTVSFTLSGVRKVRIGVQASGSTDTITSADLSYRKDAVNAAT